MNRQRRKRLEKSYELIDEAIEIIQEVIDEEQEAYDNLPENFQSGERGGEMIGYIESLEETVGFLDEAKAAMEYIQGRKETCIYYDNSCVIYGAGIIMIGRYDICYESSKTYKIQRYSCCEG